MSSFFANVIVAIVVPCFVIVDTIIVAVVAVAVVVVVAVEVVVGVVADFLPSISTGVPDPLNDCSVACLASRQCHVQSVFTYALCVCVSGRCVCVSTAVRNDK